MTVTRYPNGLAVGGANTDATSAGVICAMRFSFDPTSSSQVLLGTLPAGAVVMDVVGYGGATGGSNPTVDIGTGSADSAFANELDCDAAGTSAVAAGTIGTSKNTQLTAATPVYGKVGGSAASGGTFSGAILFVVENL